MNNLNINLNLNIFIFIWFLVLKLSFLPKKRSLLFLRLEILFQSGQFLKNSLFLEPFSASSSLYNNKKRRVYILWKEPMKIVPNCLTYVHGTRYVSEND